MDDIKDITRALFREPYSTLAQRAIYHIQAQQPPAFEHLVPRSFLCFGPLIASHFTSRDLDPTIYRQQSSLTAHPCQASCLFILSLTTVVI